MLVPYRDGRKTSLFEKFFEDFDETFGLLERMFDEEFKMRLEKLHDSLYPPMNVYKKVDDEGVKYKIILNVGKIKKEGLKVTILDDTLNISYNEKDIDESEDEGTLEKMLDKEWKPEFIEFNEDEKVKKITKWNRKLIIPSIDLESIKLDYVNDKYIIIEVISNKRKKLKELTL